jgi:hypothetical protein
VLNFKRTFWHQRVKQCERYVIKSEKCSEYGSAGMEIVWKEESTKFIAEERGYMKCQSVLTPNFSLYLLIACET